MIRFQCHHCYRAHEVPSGAAGRTGRCICGERLRVPAGAPDGADPADPADPTGPGGLLLAGPAGGAAGDDEVDLRALHLARAPAVLTPPAPRGTAPDPEESEQLRAEAAEAAGADPVPGAAPPPSSRQAAGRVAPARRWAGLLCLAGSGAACGLLAVRLWGGDLAAGLAPPWLLAPGRFWTTALAVLAGGLLVEGAARLRRSSPVRHR